MSSVGLVGSQDTKNGVTAWNVDIGPGSHRLAVLAVVASGCPFPRSTLSVRNQRLKAFPLSSAWPTIGKLSANSRSCTKTSKLIVSCGRALGFETPTMQLNLGSALPNYTT